MAANVVGVDIGTRSVRAVEVKDADKPRPTLVRFHEVALPPGAVQRGEVVEPHTVSTAVRRLWTEGKFGSKKVILGMGNQRVLTRDMSVQRMSRARIRESLPYIVQDQLPFPVADALLDFYPVSETVTDNGPSLNGLLIAAIRETVVGNVRAVEHGGLQARGVDLVPFALARLLAGSEQGSGTVCIVDIGATATTVVIATNGVPQFVRIIAAGGDDLTEALSQRLEMSAERAEEVKRLMGLRTHVTDIAYEDAMIVINETANELLTSIRNTVGYFTSARPDAPLDRIVVTGGGSHLTGLPDALGELTRLPVAEADPYLSVALSRSLNAEHLRASQSAVAVALGLALGSAA